MTHSRSRTRLRFGWLVILVLLPMLAYWFRENMFAGIGKFLVVRDRLEPADAIFILNGDLLVRPQYAAILLHEGLAPKVIIARAKDSAPVQAGAYPNITDSCISILTSLGVPESQIIQLRPTPGVEHTVDEAQALLAYCDRNQLHKVIVVTSDMHYRRARFVLRKTLRKTLVRIMLAPVAGGNFSATNWWTTEDGVVGCQDEYIKLLYYHLKY